MSAADVAVSVSVKVRLTKLTDLLWHLRARLLQGDDGRTEWISPRCDGFQQLILL